MESNYRILKDSAEDLTPTSRTTRAGSTPHQTRLTDEMKLKELEVHEKTLRIQRYTSIAALLVVLVCIYSFINI